MPEPVSDSSAPPEPDFDADLYADFSVLTPTEEDIIRAFRLSRHHL